MKKRRKDSNIVLFHIDTQKKFTKICIIRFINEAKIIPGCNCSSGLPG
jgi:hypothetical protein